MTVTAQDIVNRGVCACASSLIYTLNQGAERTGEDLENLCSQAFELAAPIDDWEEAAIQAGWSRQILNGAVNFFMPDDPQASAYADTWQGLCEEMEIEPYAREVFEHWIVTDWLADKLEAHGEKVDKDFAGLCIWARTTTGQAIYADGVMEAIAAEVNAA